MSDRRRKLAEFVGLEVAIPGAVFILTSGAWLVVLIAAVIGGLSLLVSK